jgi:hypothetical protein
LDRSAATVSAVSAAFDPAEQDLVARGAEHDRVDRDLGLGAARLRRDLAQRLVCGGHHEALDELAAAAAIEFLREGAAGKCIGIVAKKLARGGVEVDDPTAGHIDQHEGIARRLHHHAVARFVVAMGLVILLERKLRLHQPMLQLRDRAKVAAQHQDDVGIARLVDRIADREFPIRVVVMVDLDRIDLGLVAFAIGRKLGFQLGQAVFGHELANIAVFPVVETPERRVQRVGDDGFDGAFGVQHDCQVSGRCHDLAELLRPDLRRRRLVPEV